MEAGSLEESYRQHPNIPAGMATLLAAEELRVHKVGSRMKI